MAITTAEQLLHASGIGRCELVRGELRTMTPPGFEHGRVTMNLSTRLAQHVRQVTVHQTGQPAFALGESDVIRGDALIPGFDLPVRELFA